MRLLVLILVLVAACGDAVGPTSPPATVAPDQVILVVASTGGLCVEGTCSTTWTVRSDGSYSIAAPGESSDDALSAAGLEELTAALAADVGELPPFPGTCPEAYDGPRWRYEFGDRELDSCVSDLSEVDAIGVIHRVLVLGTLYP